MHYVVCLGMPPTEHAWLIIQRVRAAKTKEHCQMSSSSREQRSVKVLSEILVTSYLSSCCYAEPNLLILTVFGLL